MLGSLRPIGGFGLEGAIRFVFLLVINLLFLAGQCRILFESLISGLVDGDELWSSSTFIAGFGM